MQENIGVKTIETKNKFIADFFCVIHKLCVMKNIHFDARVFLSQNWILTTLSFFACHILYLMMKDSPFYFISIKLWVHVFLILLLTTPICLSFHLHVHVF